MLYIGAAVIIGLLVGFVALAILWLTRSVGSSIESKTIRVISGYDDLLEEKSRELAKAQARISELTQNEEVRITPEKIVVENNQDGSTTNFINVAQRISNTVYRDGSVGEIYHKIRQGFVCDTKKIFSDLNIEDKVIDEGLYTKLLKTISFDLVYKLCTLPADVQYNLLIENIPVEFKGIIEEFANDHINFDSLEFYNHAQDRAELEPKPTIIRVAPGTITQGYPKSAVVVVDNDICEGIQIEMKNTLYDFCIKTREIG